MAVWLLTVVFERLVLTPNHDTYRDLHQSGSPRTHVTMRLFQPGQIEKLFKNQRKYTVKIKPSREQAANPSDVPRAAQVAMDNNNYSTAIVRVSRRAFHL